MRFTFIIQPSPQKNRTEGLQKNFRKRSISAFFAEMHYHLVVAVVVVLVGEYDCVVEVVGQREAACTVVVVSGELLGVDEVLLCLFRVGSRISCTLSGNNLFKAVE